MTRTSHFAPRSAREVGGHLHHVDVGVRPFAIEGWNVAETSADVSTHRGGEHAERPEATTIRTAAIQGREPMALLTGSEVVEEHQQPARVGRGADELFVEEDLQMEVVVEKAMLSIPPQLSQVPDFAHRPC